MTRRKLPKRDARGRFISSGSPSRTRTPSRRTPREPALSPFHLHELEAEVAAQRQRLADLEEAYALAQEAEEAYEASLAPDADKEDIEEAYRLAEEAEQACRSTRFEEFISAPVVPHSTTETVVPRGTKPTPEEPADYEEDYQLAEEAEQAELEALEQEEIQEALDLERKEAEEEATPFPLFDFEPQDAASLAFDIIKMTADAMASHLVANDFDARATYHANSDDTVDAEVRTTIRHGQSVFEVLIKMQDKIEEMPIGCFEQICIIRPAGEDEHVTGKQWRGVRWAGMLCSHWVNYRRQRQLILIATAQQMDQNSRQRRRKKADTILFKWHWNSDEVKPERD